MRRVEDPEAWDRLVLRLPRPHILQSRLWGDLKAGWGWQVHRFAWGSPGREQAGAQVLARPAGRVPLWMGYVPRGPLLVDDEDRGLWATVLGDLEDWARGRRLASLKMDPDVSADRAEVAEVWRRRGWRPSAEQIQFPNTMRSDLSGGETALWSGLKPKTRYNIRLAERRGVKVVFGGQEDLETFYELYAATARRNGFAIRAKAYYLDAWSRFLAAGQATVILATRVGQPLAGVVPVAFGSTVWYLYGASADHGREHMGAYLAQWASLEWALARGCRSYDWWGGPTALNEGDPLWGVFRFKEGFGAQWAEQHGAWDFGPIGPLHNAYRWLVAGRRWALATRRRVRARDGR